MIIERSIYFDVVMANELNKLTLSPSPCPLPSREGKFMKSPLPLGERDRVRGM